MLNGWNIAVETTGGIVGLETHWEGNSLTLIYPTNVTAALPDDLITKTLQVSHCGPVHIYHNNVACTKSNLRLIADGELRYVNCESDLICACVPNHDECQKLTPAQLMQPYQNKFIELLIKIAKITGDIKAIHLDSGVYSLYKPITFSKNGYEFTEKKDKDNEPYCYTKSSSGIELMFEISIIEILEMTSTIIRCPASNTLTAETIIELINKLDNSKGACSPLTFALFRKIAKS